jgi:hypothetical protein
MFLSAVFLKLQMCSLYTEYQQTLLSTKYPNVFGDYLQMDAPVLILYGMVHFHLLDFHVCVLVWLLPINHLVPWCRKGDCAYMSKSCAKKSNQNVPGQTIMSSETGFCTTCDTTEHLLIKWHYGCCLCLILQLSVKHSYLTLLSSRRFLFILLAYLFGQIMLVLCFAFQHLIITPQAHTCTCTLNGALLHCFGRHVRWI